MDLKIIDFRSDTITKPTDEMRKAMGAAEVGDDVYGEDPTVNRLEQLAAMKVGKEAALFVPTGTMGNQIALLTHTEHGQEAILDDWSHIIRFEGGGLALISGLQARRISIDKGIYTANEIKKAIVINNDIHAAQTGIICIENTHNMAGGTVTPLKHLKKIYELSKAYNIPIHTDGARIFNAAAFLNCEVNEITQYTDSVMFCLSKGLCAPVGSILAGTKEFIHKARRNRKLLGGGMRQAGILASAGIIALEKMTQRLQEDHENIKLLALKLNEFDTFSIDLDSVQTNILMVNINKENIESYDFIEKMKSHGILASAITDKMLRFVTHYYISRQDILDTVERIGKII